MTYRVLIADDEPIERELICRMLRKQYGDLLETVSASNGREVISRFREKPCDIAVLDIEMPGINGLEAAEELRRENRKFNIIFLTAFDEFKYAKRAISVRALDYLLKPVMENEIFAVMDEAMRLAEERTEYAEETALPEEEIKPAVGLSEPVRLTAVQKLMLGFIETHYQEDISLQDAATAMHYSDAYFCKLFKQCFDKNFIAYLSEYRVGKAKALLADATVNVKEISEAVGYRDSNYFAKVFKRMEGMTPSEYRIYLEERQKLL